MRNMKKDRFTPVLFLSAKKSLLLISRTRQTIEMQVCLIYKIYLRFHVF